MTDKQLWLLIIVPTVCNAALFTMLARGLVLEIRKLGSPEKQP